jgi:PEP-CTERM motif-containing protein
MRYVIALSLVAFLAAPAWAVPTVDGTRDAEYGPPIVVQAVQTQFGDANPPGSLGGSELDAAYATIVGNRLYLMLTGNHEPNFNKLEVFFDTKPGGENTLSNVPQYDFFTGSGWNSQNLGGLTFDTPFTADYHLFSAWGGGGTGPYEVNFVNRNGGAAAMVPGSNEVSAPAVGLIATGAIPAGDIGTNASGTALTQNLQFAINDNNNAGVIGGTAAANAAAAAAVTTGMEFSIDLADLGSPAIGTTIRIAAMIDNGDHNYLSNQILGPLTPPQGNLGGDGGGGFTGTLSGVNFNQFDGAQYFEIRIIPEPSTILLAGLALLTAAGFSRRGRRTLAAAR